MTDILIGLDVGTTATKAVAFDLAGVALAEASSGYGLLTPGQGWVEQDPEALWRAVVEVLRTVARQLGPDDRVLALAQSSQGGTTIPVDAAGAPLGNAISWMDTRAGEQAEAVRAQVGAEFIRTTTGWPLQGGLPLQHIGWFRDNRPQLYASARHYLFVNDFIDRRLTGKLCMNPTDAGITQLFSIAAGDWDERLLALVGVRRDQLSPMHPAGRLAGTLNAEAAALTGLPVGLPVANGAHDQYCAAVGTGVMQPGKVMLSCGTAWVVLAVVDDLEVGLRSGLAIGRHVLDGRWGAMRSIGAVGSSLEWLIDNVWGARAAGADRADLYAAINAGAARAAPGAGGLLCYPLAGGHAAAFGPARGGFIGLSLPHTRDDMARAVMEGIAFELRWAVTEMRQAGIEVAELRMVGGAARSNIWPQIVADVTAIPVVLPAMSQAASRGAAILAGTAVGIFSDPQAGFAAFRGAEMSLTPESAVRQLYDDTFATYQELSAALTGWTSRPIAKPQPPTFVLEESQDG
jgi:xylulokinase